MRFNLILALLIAGSIAGYSCDKDGPTIQEILGVPTLLQYSPEEVVKHIRVMNPGAEVLVYVIDDPVMFNWFFSLPPEEAGYILGLFRARDGMAPDMAILGHWSREMGVAMHELTHYYEQQIPWAREEIREAFHKLLTPEFRIGSMDLEGPAEKDETPPVLLVPLPVPNK